jgi:hypothetical protein
MSPRNIYSVELLSVITQGLRFVCVSNSIISCHLKPSAKNRNFSKYLFYKERYVSLIMNHLEQHCLRSVSANFRGLTFYPLKKNFYYKIFFSVRAMSLAYLFNCMVALLYMPALGLQLPGWMNNATPAHTA